MRTCILPETSGPRRWRRDIVDSHVEVGIQGACAIAVAMVTPTFRSAWHWVFGKHEPKPPNADRTVEAAWLPMWQAQFVTDELIAQGVPAVWNEDFSIHMGVYQREAMARIFVTEDRRAEAEEIIEAATGLEPRHRKL